MPPLQEAQRHLDDAVNLVGVLLDALEQDADSRAEQARTVLALTVESLHRARRLVDEQDLLMEESDGEEMEDELPPRSEGCGGVSAGTSHISATHPEMLIRLAAGEPLRLPTVWRPLIDGIGCHG